MPYPSSKCAPCSSAGDTGVLVDSLLRSGGKRHGGTVVLIAEHLTADYMLSVWKESTSSLP